MPQANGGALWRGNPNPVAGPGRPPSLLRAKLTGALEERVGIATDIADGKPVQRITVDPRLLAPYVQCRACQAQGVQVLGDQPFEISVEASANPRDRLAALDFMGKFGPGIVKEVSADVVRDRVRQTLDALQAIVTPEEFVEVLRALKPIWAT